MARAKRTDRAEARRRFRVALTEAEGDGSSKAAPVPTTVSTAAIPREARARTAPARPASSGAAQRPGLLNSLRGSYGRVDVIGDIKALPDIALHSKAIWVPGLAIIATGAVMQLMGNTGGPIALLLASLVIQPPPMIVAFLAGMLAPRGAWLLGGMMSTLAALVYVAVVWTGTTTNVTPLGWTYVPTVEQKWAYASSVLLSAPVFGIAVGAFAGFYRRFLRTAAPAPQQQQQGRRRR